MRAARLHQYSSDVESAIKIDDIDPPSITSPEDVLVEIAGAGVCQTDLKLSQGKTGFDVSFPQTLGHENAGTVVETGESVTSVAPGDDVLCHNVITCGTCRPCRQQTNDVFCTSASQPGVTTDGGFAEYMVTAERAVVPLDGVDPLAVAPYSDAGVTSYHAVKQCLNRLQPGTFAMVVGVGGLGHMAVQLLSELSTATIIAVDIKEEALDLAKTLGASHAINPETEDVADRLKTITDGAGVDQIVDFVGTTSFLSNIPQLIASEGDYYIVGYTGELKLPTSSFIATEFSIHGSRSGTYAELTELMELVADDRIEMRTKKYELEEITDVLEQLQKGDILGRAILVP
jgi:D-arabinose 1-dehydrogenase-like Zn-dependent alcohol dehydrogenase